MNREERKQLWNEAVNYLGITAIYVCNDTDLFGGVKSGESEVTMVVPVLTQEIRQKKIEFFKDVVENKGGYRIFYVDEKPVRKETDVHILFRLTWHGTPSDVSREVNDGRGPADFKVSRGSSDKTMVEFKLASNTQLRKNLEKQLEIYQKASDAAAGFKVIIYFTEEELDRVKRVLRELAMEKDPHIYLVDARQDNKPSASKA